MIVQAWAFYIVLMSFPQMDVEEAREMRGPYKSAAICDYWYERWIQHNSWLAQYGIVAEKCRLVVKGKDD